MTDITLDLAQFTAALSSASNKTLGWTWLKPTVSVTDELIRPSYADPVPSVMSSFVLIDNPKYRFSYASSRYARFCYLLERNGTYEAGELSSLHYLALEPSAQTNEGQQTAEPSIFTPPLIRTTQTVLAGDFGTIGGLGVYFSFEHDITSSGSDPKFGLAFKITSVTPAVFPRLTLSYLAVVEPEIV